MPKNLNNEEVEDVPVADDPLLDVAAELVELPVAPVVAAVGPVPGKRALGVKEPIIFKWKLIGTSHNMTLTLFKSVEREDAEAQLDRLQKEGYYIDLKILEADAKVAQPRPLKGAKKPTPHGELSGKSAEKTVPRSDGGKRTASPAPAARRAGAAKAAAKTGVKPTKKKTTTATAAPKRSAKRK